MNVIARSITLMSIIFYFILFATCITLMRFALEYLATTSALCVVFSLPFFLFLFLFQPHYLTKSTMNSAWMHCSWVPQIPLFSKFLIKNWFHGTIHTFKNYFATVFLVSIFSFSKNKFNPNGSNITSILFWLGTFKIFNSRSKCVCILRSNENDPRLST